MYIILGLTFAGYILYKVLFLMDVYHTGFNFFLDVYYTRFDFCWMYIIQGLILRMYIK